MRMLAAIAALSLPVALGQATASAQAPTVQRDIQYAVRDGEPLLLDAWLPDGPGPHVAVVVVHGGRFRNAEIDKTATPADTLAAAGFAAFSVNYRLAPEHPFPAGLRDVQAAVVWIREHAEEFDVDPDRIWAIGGSAGGNLVGMLATVGEGPWDQGSRVAAAVSFSGPMNMVRWLETGGVPVVTDYLGCPVPPDEPCLEVAHQASPVSHVDPTDPPMVLVNATDEIIPLYHAQDMEEALVRNGVPRRLIMVPGHRHAWSLGREPMAEALDYVAEALAIGESPTVSPSPAPTTREVRGQGRARAPSTPGFLFPASLALLALAAALGAWRWVQRPRGGSP